MDRRRAPSRYRPESGSSDSSRDRDWNDLLKRRKNFKDKFDKLKTELTEATEALEKIGTSRFPDLNENNLRQSSFRQTLISSIFKESGDLSSKYSSNNNSNSCINSFGKSNKSSSFSFERRKNIENYSARCTVNPFADSAGSVDRATVDDKSSADRVTFAGRRTVVDKHVPSRWEGVQSTSLSQKTLPVVVETSSRGRSPPPSHPPRATPAAFLPAKLTASQSSKQVIQLTKEREESQKNRKTPTPTTTTSLKGNVKSPSKTILRQLRTHEYARVEFNEETCLLFRERFDEKLRRSRTLLTPFYLGVVVATSQVSVARCEDVDDVSVCNKNLVRALKNVESTQALILASQVDASVLWQSCHASDDGKNNKKTTLCIAEHTSDKSAPFVQASIGTVLNLLFCKNKPQHWSSKNETKSIDTTEVHDYKLNLGVLKPQDFEELRHIEAETRKHFIEKCFTEEEICSKKLDLIINEANNNNNKCTAELTDISNNNNNCTKINRYNNISEGTTGAVNNSNRGTYTKINNSHSSLINNTSQTNNVDSQNSNCTITTTNFSNNKVSTKKISNNDTVSTKTTAYDNNSNNDISISVTNSKNLEAAYTSTINNSKCEASITSANNSRNVETSILVTSNNKIDAIAATNNNSEDSISVTNSSLTESSTIVVTNNNNTSEESNTVSDNSCNNNAGTTAASNNNCNNNIVPIVANSLLHRWHTMYKPANDDSDSESEYEYEEDDPNSPYHTETTLDIEPEPECLEILTHWAQKIVQHEKDFLEEMNEKYLDKTPEWRIAEEKITHPKSREIIGLIDVTYVGDKRHGFYRQFDANGIEVTAFGRYVDDEKFGVVWKRLEGNGFVIGVEDDNNNQETGTYLYPDLTCAISGIFEGGKLKKGKFGKVVRLDLDEVGTPIPKVKTLRDDVTFIYDPSMSVCISRSPLQRDPFEHQGRILQNFFALLNLLAPIYTSTMKFIQWQFTYLLSNAYFSLRASTICRYFDSFSYSKKQHRLKLTVLSR